MRKITSSQKSKDRFNQILIGLVLVFLMLLSVLGYGLVGRQTSQENKLVYNNFEFVEVNGLWVTNIQGIQFIFKYNPNQVESIPGMVNFVNTYAGLPLYVQTDDNDAAIEVYGNFNDIVERIQPACLVNETCSDESLPVKTCDDNFIIIQESNVTDIVQEDSCVFIKGPMENLTMVADEFMFKTLGIKS